MSELFLGSDRPVTGQVADRIKRLIVERNLQRGSAIPPYRQLAADFGVAYVTIKRAMDLLGKEGVVQAIPPKGVFVAKTLGSRVPGTLARAGLIYPESHRFLFASDYLSAIFRGVMVEAQEEGGVDVHIFSMFREGLVLANRIAESRSDGVLLVGMENDEYLRKFVTWGTPGVVLDYVPPDDINIEGVACDNAAAARRAIAELTALGHSRFLYVGPAIERTIPTARNGNSVFAKSSSDVRERRFESELAVLEAGATFTDASTSLDEDWLLGEGSPLLARLESAEPPTAILAYDDAAARLLLNVLDRRGLRAPEDVSVVALAAAGDVVQNGRIVTACRFDFMDMGRRGIQLLRAACMRRKATPARTHRIGFEFVAGQTIGRAKGVG